MVILQVDTTAATSHFPAAAISVLALGFVMAASIGSLAWFKSRRPIGWQDEGPSGEAPANSGPGFDRGMVDGETAARQAREGSSFKQQPTSEGGSDYTSGYTSDQEGRLNNYAVEPEMYVEERGDLRQEEEDADADRAEEIKEINRPGGKGPGII